MERGRENNWEKLYMISRDEAVEAKTQNEILSQPGCWEECFKALEESAQLEQAARWDTGDAEYLFIGCGSSYYISQAAAASWGLITGRRAWAVPASEVLLFPDLVLNGSAKCQPVLVSRSGHSSEVVRAAQFLEHTRNIRTLAISCSEGHPLEEISAFTIHLLPADEKSVVMTRSFTSMLLGLQSLAAHVARRKEITDGLRRLPAAVQPILDSVNPRIQEFVQARSFADYVFLGQGPFFGIASEGQLKIKEMSCSYAQVFHTLEFRHGPKAIVGPETLLTFLLSETGYTAEREVLEEMKELGGTTLVITNQADAVVRRNADFLVELKLEVPECARLAAYLITCQLLGLYTGLKKGYDIDRPRNLSRAVILTESGA
jgi:glutamine---fructose-6-phosphate transaminase (isomerizing)